MRFLICFALLTSFAALFATAAEGAELRNWKSADGKFEVEAKFIELEMQPDGELMVVLDSKTGKTLRVPLGKLSDEDQAYIKKQGKGDAELEWDFKSQKAMTAVNKYQSAKEKIEATESKDLERLRKKTQSYSQEKNKNRLRLVAALEKEFNAETKAGNLDEAVTLRDAIEAVQKGADPESKSDTKSDIIHRFFDMDLDRNLFIVRSDKTIDFGYKRSYFGRERVFQTHPVGISQPTVLTKTIKIPKRGRYSLWLGVAGHIESGNHDCIVEVQVNGRKLLRETIRPTSPSKAWQDFRVNLTPYAGKKIRLSLIHRAGGPDAKWNYEFAYWSRAEVMRD